MEKAEQLAWTKTANGSNKLVALLKMKKGQEHNKYKSLRFLQIFADLISSRFLQVLYEFPAYVSS